MKTSSSLIATRRRLSGFTLIELMTVVAIMAVLASLTIVGFRVAQTTAARNRTAAFHSAIKSGLEQYFGENGEYPTPSDTSSSGQFQGKTYIIGPAIMLYQVLSGDGDSGIVLGSSKLGASDGEVTANEVEYITLTDMPREMVRSYENQWIVIDGFNLPFQYTKGPARARPGQQPPAQWGIAPDCSLAVVA